MVVADVFSAGVDVPVRIRGGAADEWFHRRGRCQGRCEDVGYIESAFADVGDGQKAAWGCRVDGRGKRFWRPCGV